MRDRRGMGTGKGRAGRKGNGEGRKEYGGTGQPRGREREENKSRSGFTAEGLSLDTEGRERTGRMEGRLRKERE